MVQLLLPIIYISFISLGLPDSLLGSAWPSMYPALGVPVSYAGLISMIISFGTIVSSLNSDRLTRALGTGKVTVLSVAMTAAALFGFSISTQFWMLCLWAVPYGLGAGSVDAALNNYVALHYKSRHMSWLHCMWGIGTMISPMVMGRVLAGGGRIFLARAGEEIVGMMMLELFRDGVAEPFKFGVKAPWRNRGIGKALMRATIDAARELGVHTLVLTSHHSLKAALHVYESFGFRYEAHDNVAFALSDIMMKMEL